jgi:hypothetical protein
MVISRQRVARMDIAFPSVSRTRQQSSHKCSARPKRIWWSRYEYSPCCIGRRNTAKKRRWKCQFSFRRSQRFCQSWRQKRRGKQYNAEFGDRAITNAPCWARWTHTNFKARYVGAKSEEPSRSRACRVAEHAWISTRLSAASAMPGTARAAGFSPEQQRAAPYGRGVAQHGLLPIARIVLERMARQRRTRLRFVRSRSSLR